MDDTYARILSNIDHDHTQHVHRILRWLTFSARPLKLEELAEVVAIDFEETPQFDPERRFADIQDILEPCSSLISAIGNTHRIPKLVFRDENGMQQGVDEEKSPVYVRLAHFTVKEFLLSQRIRQGTGRIYGLEEINSNRLIAEDCLAYLLHITPLEALDTAYIGSYPLARYAASNWFDHTRIAVDSNGRTNALIMELFGSKKTAALNNWIRLYNCTTLCPESSVDSCENAHPLYFSSLLGLSWTVNWLTVRGADVNARCGKHGNALCAATWGGHQQVVRLLLSKGASINQLGGHYGNALQTASWLGNGNLICLFLEHGADINIQGLVGKTALHQAVEAGNKDCAQILLKKGADADVRDVYGDTALIKAAQHYNLKMARLLVEAGGDINIQNISGVSALMEAAGKNHPDIVRLLLENGANLHLQSKTGEVALLKATRAGHGMVIRQLLLHEAVTDLDIQQQVRAIKRVIFEEYKVVVEFLLEEMSEPRYTDVKGKTAPYHAAAEGRYAIIEVLLKHKANLLSVDKHDENCSYDAAEGGPNRTSRLLLDKRKADPDITNLDGLMALPWASRYGSADTIRILQDASTDSIPESIRDTNRWQRGSIYEILSTLDIDPHELAETLRTPASRWKAEVIAFTKMKRVICDGCHKVSLLYLHNAVSFILINVRGSLVPGISALIARASITAGGARSHQTTRTQVINSLETQHCLSLKLRQSGKRNCNGLVVRAVESNPEWHST